MISATAVDHPAIRDTHAIAMRRAFFNNIVISVATCRCGWSNRTRVSLQAKQDRAIDQHFAEVIAAAEAPERATRDENHPRYPRNPNIGVAS
jgi:hypothetical protein